MTPERWARIKDVYWRAIEIPAERQPEFVEGQCRTSEGVLDAGMCSEVLRLLEVSSESGAGAVIDRLAPFGPGSSLAATQQPLEPGESLGGRFLIVRRLGAGGMGEVYEAEDSELGGRVALKTILPSLAGNAAVLSRFRREVHLARQVTHPNVCRIFDLMRLPRSNGGGEVDFLTMELLDGEPLSAMLRRRGSMAREEAMPVIAQIAAGLQAAHDAGVIHRDVKSSNIFLAKDRSGGMRVVVTDFGLARHAPGDAASTHAPSTAWGAGTPAYMAPEQVEGKAVGPAADQYSLGVVMYEMATGAQPYAGESPLQVAVRRTKERPRPPRQLEPGVDPRWEAVILRCLEIDPSDRFPGVAQAVEALGQPTSRIYVRRGTVRRMAYVLPAAAVLLAGGWAASTRWRRLDPLPPEVDRLYREGSAAVMNGSWHRARVALEAAVRVKPDFAEARARLAESLTELDHFDRARTEILRATDLPKRSTAEDLLVRGTRGLVLRDFPGACETFQERLGRVEDALRNQALLDLARCQDKAFLTAAAQRAYEQVLAADPSNPAALVGLAGVEDRQSHSGRALELLDRARASYEQMNFQDGMAELDLLRATILDQTSRLPEARAAVERAAETARLVRNDYVALRARLLSASIAIKLGDAPAGKAMAAQAVEQARASGLETTLASGLIDLGSAFFSQRQIEDARVYTEQALTTAEASGAKRLAATAQRQLANVYGQMEGRTKDMYPLLDKAEAFFTAANMQRDLLRARSARASGLFVDDPEAARRLFRELIPLARQLNEGRTETLGWANLGKLALLQDDFLAAAENYAKAVAAARSHGLVAMALLYTTRAAEAQAFLGDYARAEKALRETLADPALKDEAVRLAAFRALGGVLSQQLRFSESKVFLDQALARAQSLKQGGDLRAIQLQSCVTAGEAGWRAEAMRLCAPLAKAFTSEGAWGPLAEVLTTMALLSLDAGRYPDAIRHAAEARRRAEQEKGERKAWYALLIQADAQKRGGDAAGFQRSAALAREEFSSIASRWGKEASAAYLRRPGIARRWNVVKQ